MKLLNLMPVLYELKQRGGLPLLAGGFVRDRVLGIPSKDIDVEVYGLDVEKVAEILSGFGEVVEVGKSFGVLKLRIKKPGLGIDEEYDFSLPRRELKIAGGHRGFEVTSDPWMQPKDACSRRDFTFNAMLQDVFSGEILDFFEGRVDLGDRVIRHVSDEHFGEDPLRALRAFQFAGRFDMTLDRDTALLICRMVANGELDELPLDRIWTEWEKWAVKSIRPSAGLLVLKQTAMLRMFPELQALDGLQQDPEHHPEGDAWQHTLHAVDAACEIADREQLDDEMRLVLVMAALCHDLGKPATTKVDQDGKVTTYGHDKAGVGPTEAFLKRIRAPHWVVDHVLPLVRNHMVFRFRGDFKARTYRRLALKMQPSNLRMLARVMEADGCARPPKPREDPFPELLTWAEDLNVVDDAPKPILMGRHLLELGCHPGPDVGKLIRRSFEAQLDGAFDDEAGAIKWAKAELSQPIREVCGRCGLLMPTAAEMVKGEAEGDLIVCWGGSPCDNGHSCK